jgi:hypothetical protein
MTTTDIAVIPSDDAEIAEWQPLSKRDAKKLDTQIRRKSDAAVKNHTKTLELFDELKELLTTARDGEIHKALGLKSWTAYLADAVNIDVPQREDRKALTQFLSGQGMSQRAIASTLNVSQKTVDRDLEDEEVQEGATVTSLDGAVRPKNGRQADVIDAEVVDDEEDSEGVVYEALTAVSIVKAFDDETTALWQAWAEMKELMAEDKWSNARKRVANANMENLGEVAKGLQDILDDLMTG